MAEYPYGGNYGAQENVNSNPNPNPNPSYLPPTWPAQYMQAQPGDAGRIGQAQGNMASNFDGSMAGYNSYPPPPPPAFNLATVAPPIFQGWNQDSMPLPPYNPNNNQQYMGHADSNAQNAHHNSQYYASHPTSAYQPNHQVMPPLSQPYDEGEVSENEFRSASHQMNNHGTNQNQLDRNRNGYGHHPQNSPYNAAQGAQRNDRAANGYSGPHRDSPQSRVQSTDAYSPYGSPKIAGQQANGNNSSRSNTNKHAQGWGNEGSRDKPGGKKNTAAPKVSETQPNANAAGTPTSADTAKQQPSLHLPPPSSAQVPSATVSKPLADSRKKAESAVLNLLPYGIRYQHYVDEGIKSDLVGCIFDDLRQPRGPIKAGVAESTSTSNGAPMASQQASNGVAAPKPNQTNGKDVNGAGLPKLSTSQTPSAPSTAAMTEKERTLQSKMEALRKSREERAQKAAAKAKSPTDTNSPTLPAPIQSQSQPQPSVVAPPVVAPVSKPEPPPVSLPARPNFAVPSQSPQQPVNPTPKAPVIPGLFLSSSISSPAPTVANSSKMTTTGQIPSNHRKRPVASDFEQPIPPMSTFKRPFGHSRNDQLLVIDVSEDEIDSDEEDVEMDLESQADQDSPSQPLRKLSENRSGTGMSLPGLVDSSRKPFSSPPNSATNTPPVSQNGTKFTIGRPEVLQRKESEIEQLKKKIAEAEARKKARQTPTGGQTPREANTQSGDTKGASGIANLASKVEASMKMQQLIRVVDDKVNSDQQRLVETHVAEAASVAEFKKKEEESKRLRLQKIASDLPLVDAQVQQSQSKLEQLRAEMTRLELEVQKNLEAKRQMADEMERLGRETEHQLQAQREKLQDLTEEEIAVNTAPSQPSNTGNSSVNLEATTNEDQPQEAAQEVAQSSDEMMTDAPEEPNVSTSSRTSNDPQESQEKVETETTDVDSSSAQQASDPKQQVSADQALEAALQEAVRAEADSHAQAYSDTEMKNSFAPDPDQLAPESSPNQAEKETCSPEYTPALEGTTTEDLDGESDIYEPPEATPPVDTPPPVESPPFSPAPPEVIRPADVDEPMQVSDASEDQDVQDLALRDTPLRAVVPPSLSNVEDKPEQTQIFTPYESPLKYFRAFRFHPNYKQEVAGGLRSLTFSNKIDPLKEFCRFELAGGVCNDHTCEFQHFREIGLPGAWVF
ncbi:hypothetical protein HYALB_00005007 [Hymenoscyphus albidus]|uniref:Putative zinc-finger domain-containing protein n=1 Tax=Hymenoscyphus albidus TaxID=595503 RepID=A0A9N9LHB3_9HELO|nr:hypothetical protein HYALB_00005007 [Hymenoscyphus albidus]